MRSIPIQCTTLDKEKERKNRTNNLNNKWQTAKFSCGPFILNNLRDRNVLLITFSHALA